MQHDAAGGAAPAECVAAAAAADAASRGQPRPSVSSPPRLALKVTCRPLDRKARESDCLRPFLGLGPSRRQPSELLLASPDSKSFAAMVCGLPAAGREEGCALEQRLRLWRHAQRTGPPAKVASLLTNNGAALPLGMRHPMGNAWGRRRRQPFHQADII